MKNVQITTVDLARGGFIWIFERWIYFEAILIRIVVQEPIAHSTPPACPSSRSGEGSFVAAPRGGSAAARRRMIFSSPSTRGKRDAGE